MYQVRALLLAVFALAACTPRPGVVLEPQAEEIGTVHRIFFSTTRDADRPEKLGIRRSYAPLFGRIDISVPPEHVVGRMEVAATTPDPEKKFVTTETALYSSSGEFRSQLSTVLRDKPRGSREVLIFVHGFNTNFAEGAFRTAQLAHDFNIDGVVVHYSWPSRANPVAYAYDRDSALFARDGLEQLIAEVNAAGAESVILMGHSMGALLSMEAMRQMAIRSPALLHRSVDAVVLLSPDIDVQVFRSQVRRIGKLPEPFIIFISNRDGALALSARLTGERNRLGNVSSIEQVADLDVTIFNVTEFSKISDLGHFTIGTSPALINLLSGLPDINALISGDTSGRTGLVSGTILTLQDATEIILSPISPY
ncbi:alpha/beta hydrolase [Actibacterium sp. D379-3]